MSQLTSEQRYAISVMYQSGQSQKSIAQAIGKDKSVISRELKRNRNPDNGKYTYSCAQELSELRKERLRLPRGFTGEVANRINRYMRTHEWSPEQIVGYCKLKDYAMVSIERIYQYIRLDKKSGGDLYRSCRHKLKHRKRPVSGSIPIKDRVCIEDRPPEADGKRFGDWEMDTIVGPANKDAMLTLVERSKGYTIIKKLPLGKCAKGVAEAVITALLPYKDFVRTITTDNGTEFAEHKRIAEKLNTTVYFAHPYCSWEKGLIEYTNKLYRQYIPKGVGFDKFSEEEVRKIQYKINQRPRKKIDFDTPLNAFFVALRT